MLFEAIVRSLDVVSDVIEFGPAKAAKINTSVSPEAERACTRILDNLERVNGRNTMLHENSAPVMEKESEKESVLDQLEEDMINEAVEEKGYY